MHGRVAVLSDQTITQFYCVWQEHKKSTLFFIRVLMIFARASKGCNLSETSFRNYNLIVLFNQKPLGSQSIFFL